MDIDRDFINDIMTQDGTVLWGDVGVWIGGLYVVMHLFL